MAATPADSSLESEVERLSEQLSHSYEELALVYGISARMTVDRDPHAFLAETLQELAGVTASCGAGLYVWDEKLGQREQIWLGRPNFNETDLHRLNECLKAILLELGNGCATDSDGFFFLSNELATHPLLAWLAPHGRQLLAVPLCRGGTTAGCVFVIDKDVAPDMFGVYNEGAYTSIDRKLVAGVATHTAIFLENRRLFADTEDLMMGLLHAMVAAVDAKDAYTRGHSVRVALFAKRLAEELGHDPDYCQRIYLSGLLHDVGKIGVDDAVIRKPGKLDDEEFHQIKQHPEIGYRILKSVPKIADVLPGVLYHHEKVNGRGYPHGLVGEAIPELGRIMCIADSFDAMTSSRTYRTAMPLVAALAEVKNCAGTQFDAAMAEAFCRIPESEFVALIAFEREGKPPLTMLRAMPAPVKRVA